MTPILFGEMAPLAAPILTQTPFDGVIVAPELAAILYALLLGALIGSFLAILREGLAGGYSRPRPQKLIARRKHIPLPHAA